MLNLVDLKSLKVTAVNSLQCNVNNINNKFIERTGTRVSSALGSSSTQSNSQRCHLPY